MPAGPAAGSGRVVASAPPPRVTGTARAPVRFLPLPRRHATSRLRAGQLVALQVLALAVVVATTGPGWVLFLVLVAAAAGLALTLGRRRGRWWFEVLARRREFGARRRAVARANAGRSGDPRLGWLAPSLSVREVELRGNQFGVGVDQAGWFVALAVLPPSGPEAERRLIEAVDRLGQVLVETDIPVTTLQLVHHTVPVATLTSPAGQWWWVAMRLAVPDAGAAAAGRGGGPDGVHRALAAAAGRVQKTMRAAGLAHSRLLTAGELAGAVAVVGGLGAGIPPGGGGPTERWHAWCGPDAAHVCFRLSGSPAYTVSDLAVGLSRSAVLSWTVSVLLRAGGGAGAAAGGAVSVSALLRVAVAGHPRLATLPEITATAGWLGLGLARLDGAHGSAVYAAAPTALPPPA